MARPLKSDVLLVDSAIHFTADQVHVKRADTKTVARIGPDASFSLQRPSGKSNITLSGVTAQGVIGGGGNAGKLSLKRANGRETIGLNAHAASLRLGGSGADGEVYVTTSRGGLSITLNGDSGNAILGGNRTVGDVRLLDRQSNEIVRISGTRRMISAGGAGIGAVLDLRASNGRSRFKASARNGQVVLGGAGVPGVLRMRRADNRNILTFDTRGGKARLTVGARGLDGKLVVHGASAPWSRTTIDRFGIVLKNDTLESIALETRTGKVTLRALEAKVPRGSWPDWQGGTSATNTVDLLAEISRLKQELYLVQSRLTAIGG